MKKQRPKRILAMTILLFCIIPLFVTTANATTEPITNNFWENVQQADPMFTIPKRDYIGEMNNIAMFWYKIIRNYIAVPLLILSFATCGYKFFMCAFMGKPEYAIDAVKKQFFNTVIAMFVLFLLPVIMSIARNLTESTQWSPPGSSGSDYWQPIETTPTQ